MSEAIYELRDPFKYARADGDIAEATFISLAAPNYRQIPKSTPLKQAFAAAVNEMTAAAGDRASDVAPGPSDESTSIEPGQALQVLYTWSGDATKALLHAADLFKSGAAMVEGDVKVTEAILDKLTARDFEGLVGTYLVNFIVPSLTGGA